MDAIHSRALYGYFTQIIFNLGDGVLIALQLAAAGIHLGFQLILGLLQLVLKILQLNDNLPNLIREVVRSRFRDSGLGLLHLRFAVFIQLLLELLIADRLLGIVHMHG